MKKIITAAFALVMVLSMGTMSAFASTTGTGTQADPYVITDYLDLFTNYDSGDCVKLANDITSTNGLVVGNEELTIDLDGHTLTLPYISLTGNAVLNVSGGTITSAAYPTSHVQNMISLNDTSVLNAENMYLIAGKEDDMNMAPYAVSSMTGTKANLTNCYVKGGDSDAITGDYMAPGVPLVTYGGTITLSDSTLAIGNGGDWANNTSCAAFEIYTSGAVQDKNNNAITPTVFSVSDTKEQKIGTGYPAATVNKKTITSVSSGFNEATADVKGTYQASSTATTVYNVDVVWGSMEFTYKAGSEGIWDPEAHAYIGAKDGVWSSDTDANKITVTNHSNTAIDATLSYAEEASFSAVSGTFTETSGTANDNKLALATAVGTTLANAPKADAFLKLDGALTAGVKSTKIGAVTVTITEQSGNGSGEVSL